MKDIFLVDADETLLDFRRSEYEQLRAVLTEAGNEATDDVCARFHVINDGLWKALERGETTRDALVVERFRLLLAEFGLRGEARRISERYFELLKESAWLLDGAMDFLLALKERGRVYIVTNGTAVIQRSRLALSGIAGRADGVFISQEAGADKPSRLYAEYVEGHIPDYERARAVWIGDSLTSDGACARGAGIDFILYAPGGAPKHYLGPYAHSYAEIFEILKRFDMLPNA